MRSKFSGSLLLLFLLVFAQTLYAKTDPEMLAFRAVSENSPESEPAISELRRLGPAGLNLLFQVYANQINQQVSNPLLAATPEWRRLSKALDAVSQQKDSYLSGLYWYTDFGQAKAAARTAGKPILSLRLLGKLSEEYSCANSRFFRTILYSNGEVSKMLRERFILHWQSERPAPRITIDFGDGRKLERTLTGNSIHYILDANGRPIDALPGLYGPEAFLRLLRQTEEAFKQRSKFANNVSFEFSSYPRARLSAINVAWFTDIQKTGGKIPEGLLIERNDAGTPTAIQVAALAMTKMVTEFTILRAMAAGSEALGTVTDEAAWKKIALLHIADAQLDSRSIDLIKRQTRNTFMNNGSVDPTDAALENLVQKLQLNIALDTVRNEYVLHTKLYAWLMADPSGRSVDALNKKVYAELFLTPASDPWLGLFSPEVYTALEGGGIRR